MTKKMTVILFAVLVLGTQAFASGFSIYEQGAKATALGGAFIAQANDPTAIFYNPAGITSLSGLQIGVGTTLIMPQFGFQGPAYFDSKLYTAAEDAVFPPTTIYLSYKVTDNLSAGFGFYTPFGLGSDWDPEWPGRQLSTSAEVQTFYLNPVVAYKVLDNLSVAAGLNFVFATVSIGKSVYFTPRELFGESKLEANTTGMGFNFGVQYKPFEGLSLGATYRPNTMLEFKDGDATFDFPTTDNAVVNAEVAAYFPDTKGSADLELPTVLGLGAAYQFTPQITAEFDYLLIGWSSYDKLVIKFDDPVAGNTESTAERMYEDSYSLRFGVNYQMNETMALRLGYLRDNHAVPDERVEPSLPEGDRNLYSIGLGYKMGNMTIDGTYVLLLQDDREITTSVDNFNGTYTGLANMFGVSFGFSF